MSDEQAKKVYYFLMNPNSPKTNWENETEKRKDAFRGLLTSGNPALDMPATLGNMLSALGEDFPMHGEEYGQARRVETPPPNVQKPAPPFLSRCFNYIRHALRMRCSTN